MKKRMLALAMAIGLTLSMTACGPKEDPKPTDTPAPEETTPVETSVPTADSDLAYVKENGKLKVGFTYYEPMNYIDDDGNFVGFETEFAQNVAQKLGVEADFVEINWDSKFMELQSKNVDCLWNGMTATDEVKEALTVSDSYIQNYQVVVVRAADAEKYKTTADLANAKIDAEAGSAGEASIAADENLSKAEYTSVPKQTDALFEVKTNAADACVLDFVLANAMVGNGDYADLAVVPDLRLSVEEYAVGLRKDSDLANEINEAIKAMLADGSLQALAEKYGLADQLITP